MCYNSEQSKTTGSSVYSTILPFFSFKTFHLMLGAFLAGNGHTMAIRGSHKRDTSPTQSCLWLTVWMWVTLWVGGNQFYSVTGTVCTYCDLPNRGWAPVVVSSWFNTCFFFFFLIEVQLIYNVSRVHRSDSDFPGGLAGEESISNAGDLGLIPGLGRSPGEGKGYPLQYSDLENSKDWIVHGITKSQTQPSDFRFTFKVIQLHLSRYRCISSFSDSFPL